MKLEKKLLTRLSMIVQLVFIGAWISNLKYSDSYFSVYAACCIVAVLGLFENYSSMVNEQKFDGGGYAHCVYNPIRTVFTGSCSC